MAQVYSTFVNGGVAPEPVFIKTIKNKSGEVIWTHDKENKPDTQKVAFFKLYKTSYAFIYAINRKQRNRLTIAHNLQIK